MVRVFANVQVDWDSVPGRINTKNFKRVFDALLLNT